MSFKKPNKADKKKREKFDKVHPEGRSAFSAGKEVERQAKKQVEHEKRGAKGHNPKPRKVLK